MQNFQNKIMLDNKPLKLFGIELDDAAYHLIALVKRKNDIWETYDYDDLDAKKEIEISQTTTKRFLCYFMSFGMNKQIEAIGIRLNSELQFKLPQWHQIMSMASHEINSTCYSMVRIQIYRQNCSMTITTCNAAGTVSCMNIYLETGLQHDEHENCNQ